MYAVGSLFSGIGGIELGLEQADERFRTAWFVEKEEFAQAVLRKNWPETPIYADVTEIDFRDLPEVDVLTGGFPCQDISLAGKGAGIEGSRSGLWAYCAEAISALRPRVALFENVAALTSRGLDRVLADLASLGYDAEWHCFSASSVGALHRRDRIAIIAYLAPDSNSGQRGGAQEEVSAGRDSTHSSVQGVDRGEASTHASSERARGVPEDVQERESEPRSDGDDADSDGERRDNRSDCWGGRQVLRDGKRSASQSQQERRGRQRGTREDSKDVPNSQSERARTIHVRQGRSRQQAPYAYRSGEETPNTDSFWMRQLGFLQRFPSGFWSTEPLLGRVADGVPDRVDRIKALGNAVVPAWAESVGRAIIRSGVLE